MSQGYGIDEYGIGTYGPDLGPATPGLTELLLDPIEVAESRIALSLNAGAIRPLEDGPDWGEAAIEAYMAEMAVGQVAVDYRIPNRMVRIPLMLGATPAGFREALRRLRAKTALLQREGGWLRRDDMYADVVNATLTLPDKWDFKDLEVDVILTLECIPEFYMDEETLTSHVEASRPTCVFVEANLKGDFPGRARVVVSEFASQYQRGLAWGFRCRHYDPASTAQLFYRAQDMTTMGATTAVPLSGSVSGTVLRNTTISSAAWTPIFGTDITDGPLTHTGSYRVFARVYHTGSSATGVKARFVWDVGDLTYPSVNDGWQIPSPFQFFIADLGEVRLDAAPVGDHRWRGQVQAKTDTGTAPVHVDELWFQPLDDGAGLLRAPLSGATSPFSSFVARDEFDQTAGGLAGKTLPVGGSWIGTGDADDFSIVSGTAVRATPSPDSDLYTGRYMLAGSTSYGAIAAQITATRTSPATFNPGTVRQGVLVRYVDINNWLMAVQETVFGGVPQPYHTRLLKRVGGTVTELFSQVGYGGTLRLTAAATGHYSLWTYGGADPGEAVAVGADGDLAAGGALASGRVGFYEANTMPSGYVRTYDNFSAWAPDQDAVMFPGRACELRWDGMFRETLDTNRYGPVTIVEGDLARVPVAGLEQRPVEVFIKASRGDFAGLPDSGIDDVAVTLHYRPCFLFPREGG